MGTRGGAKQEKEAKAEVDQLVTKFRDSFAKEGDEPHCQYVFDQLTLSHMIVTKYG